MNIQWKISSISDILYKPLSNKITETGDAGFGYFMSYLLSLE